MCHFSGGSDLPVNKQNLLTLDTPYTLVKPIYSKQLAGVNDRIRVSEVALPPLKTYVCIVKTSTFAFSLKRED
jgi:hypothetical protein